MRVFHIPNQMYYIFLNRVHSPIDNRSMAGVTSIRVHRSANFSNSNHIIRWTEVFVLRSGGCDDDDNANDGGGGATSSTRDSVDISKLAEQIARSAAMALVSYLDLLSASKFRRIGLRTTLALENVRGLYNRLLSVGIHGFCFL